MDQKTEDKLELAVMRYVEGLSIDDLVSWVTDDLWHSYRNRLDADMVSEFIDQMQITDEDLE